MRVLVSRGQNPCEKDSRGMPRFLAFSSGAYAAKVLGYAAEHCEVVPGQAARAFTSTAYQSAKSTLQAADEFYVGVSNSPAAEASAVIAKEAGDGASLALEGLTNEGLKGMLLHPLRSEEHVKLKRQWWAVRDVMSQVKQWLMTSFKLLASAIELSLSPSIRWAKPRTYGNFLLSPSRSWAAVLLSIATLFAMVFASLFLASLLWRTHLTTFRTWCPNEEGATIRSISQYHYCIPQTSPRQSKSHYPVSSNPPRIPCQTSTTSNAFSWTHYTTTQHLIILPPQPSHRPIT
eukprot:GHVP01053786.1.p1 GENE.GHVP01053786.1~~GHVP01053786.1.p1  ORF type:complete len:290 (-),score=14.60 GHVP01053786.1:647-1516(-)